MSGVPEGIESNKPRPKLNLKDGQRLRFVSRERTGRVRGVHGQGAVDTGQAWLHGGGRRGRLAGGFGHGQRGECAGRQRHSTGHLYGHGRAVVFLTYR